jgi:hypothetical protein
LPLYEVIKQAAQLSGRTIGEEVSYRTTQSFERDKILDAAREEARKTLETAHKGARELMAHARDARDSDIRRVMTNVGFTRILGSQGVYWAEPGVTEPMQETLSTAFKAGLAEIVKQAVAEMNAAKEQPK